MANATGDSWDTHCALGSLPRLIACPHLRSLKIAGHSAKDPQTWRTPYTAMGPPMDHHTQPTRPPHRKDGTFTHCYLGRHPNIRSRKLLTVFAQEQRQPCRDRCPRCRSLCCWGWCRWLEQTLLEPCTARCWFTCWCEPMQLRHSVLSLLWYWPHEAARACWHVLSAPSQLARSAAATMAQLRAPGMAQSVQRSGWSLGVADAVAPSRSAAARQPPLQAPRRPRSFARVQSGSESLLCHWCR